MRSTLHAPRRVKELRRDPPQRHKQPAPLWQAVIARGRLLALRAARTDAAMRLQENLNPVHPALAGTHPHISVHEAHKTLYLIQDGLKL